MRALIVEDGFARGGLAAVRALSRAGWTVGVASPSRSLAAWSRYTRHWHLVSSPVTDLDAFLEGIRGAIEERRYEVVFGCGDAEVLALSFGRDRLRARVPYPAHDRVATALDKIRLGEIARRAGLATPKTEPATTEALDDFDVPVVVKSRTHWVPASHAATGRFEATMCETRQAVLRKIEEIRSQGGNPVLQEVVRGRLTALTVLIDADGDVIASVQQQAERIWPPYLGVSVRAETVALDVDLHDKVVAMLSGLAWFGLAQLQFLVPDGADPRLIDFNGRFYGSLALAVAAGVNLPAAWAALAVGRHGLRHGPAREGVRYQWLEGDLRRAFAERRAGVASDVYSCLAYSVGAAHSIWDPRDPAPALKHGGRLAARAFRKLAA